MSGDLRRDWRAVVKAREAVFNAPDIRARLWALFHFQGLLVQFFDAHFARLDAWADS